MTTWNWSSTAGTKITKNAAVTRMRAMYTAAIATARGMRLESRRTTGERPYASRIAMMKTSVVRRARVITYSTRMMPAAMSATRPMSRQLGDPAADAAAGAADDPPEDESIIARPG